MKPRFGRGLVVGKFSPLHRGHEALIHRARRECGELFVLSYSKPEFPGCDAETRKRWFAELFPGVRHEALTDAASPVPLPSNEADSVEHRKFCARICETVFKGPVDAVFTGEDYGDDFAAELSRSFGAGRVVHIRVDRAEIPISATDLRRDIHARRQWLSPAVYASFVRRVAILGGESTGKSTLSSALAAAFGTVHAAEYGRELWESKAGRLDFEDLERIARVQVGREEEAARRAVEFLFCDTTPLTTLFYSRHLFGKAAAGLEELADRKYDVTFLCLPDFPFKQDGTRQPEPFRNRQHEWYERELARREIPFEALDGSLETRVTRVRTLLNPR